MRMDRRTDSFNRLVKRAEFSTTPPPPNPPQKKTKTKEKGTKMGGENEEDLDNTGKTRV